MNNWEQEDISVEGHTAIYYANDPHTQTRRVDFTDHVNVLKKVMGNLVANNKPRFISISGQTGSGATGLSCVLANDGINVKHIDVLSLRHPYSSDPIEISGLLRDRTKSYIIDGLQFSSPECLPEIERHIESGGTIIAFVHVRDQLKCGIEPRWLELDKTGLRSSLEFK